jgi:hypothetical protein
MKFDFIAFIGIGASQIFFIHFKGTSGLVHDCLPICDVVWSGRNYKYADVSEKRAVRLHCTTSLRLVHFIVTAVRSPHTQ